MAMIARRLGLDFKTVRRYLVADIVKQLVAGGVRAGKLDPFKPHLHQRLMAGARRPPRCTPKSSTRATPGATTPSSDT